MLPIVASSPTLGRIQILIRFPGIRVLEKLTANRHKRQNNSIILFHLETAFG